MINLEDFLLTLAIVAFVLIIWLCPGVFIATLCGFEAWSAAWIVTAIGWFPIGVVMFFMGYVVVALAVLVLTAFAALVLGRLER